MRYRISVLDKGNHPLGDIIQNFLDDRLAIQYAAFLLEQASAAEVWCGDRLVTRLVAGG